MNRCFLCGVKTLVLIKCKCHNHYCSKCRDAEKHSCTFDYRKNAQTELENKNPKVVAKKIDEI